MYSVYIINFYNFIIQNNELNILLCSNPEKMSTTFLTLLRSAVLNVKEEDDRLASEVSILLFFKS